MSPVFYMFTDRERGYRVIEAITGARMHPGWFRIGGLSMPTCRTAGTGWCANSWTGCRSGSTTTTAWCCATRFFAPAPSAIAAYDTATALDWGVTGPGLRATGCDWDVRKARPYGGFENFEFEVPTGTHGDCYDRTLVRVEEIRQSLRIIRQCLDHMPSGPIKADHPLTTPPPRERMLHDIETHDPSFRRRQLGAGGAGRRSHRPGRDGARADAVSRSSPTARPRAIARRIRTPSFPHLQMISAIAPGHDGGRPRRLSRQHRLRDVGRRPMTLSTANHQSDPRRRRAPRRRRRRRCWKRLKLVQAAEGWVSDAHLAEAAHDARRHHRRDRQPRHLLQPHLPLARSARP